MSVYIETYLFVGRCRHCSDTKRLQSLTEDILENKIAHDHVMSARAVTEMGSSRFTLVVQRAAPFEEVDQLVEVFASGITSLAHDRDWLESLTKKSMRADMVAYDFSLNRVVATQQHYIANSQGFLQYTKTI